MIYCQEFFGKRLQEARRKKGLTLLEAELLTGIDDTKLSRIENGIRNATVEEIGILANAYEVSVD